MKSALLTKAALCICPPAIVATSAATIPPVRRAVHHMTQAYEPHRPAAPKGPPCVPVQHKTFASNLPAGATLDDVPEPVAMTAIPPTTNTPIGPTPLNPPAIPSGPTVVPPPNGPSGAPEPAAWMTMVLGFGMVGAGVRQRRRQVARGRRLATATGSGGVGYSDGSGTLLGGGGGMGLTAVLASFASPVGAATRLGQMGSKALHSSMLAKAAMCICPPVAMAIGATTVPPIRHAVYSATAPSKPKAPLAGAVLDSGLPCVPVDVPTAAESVRQSGDQLAVFKPAPGFPG